MESVRKNYIYSVLYQILVLIVPLITAPYLTRVMGANRLGVYSYTNSIAYYFTLIALLGMANYGNRTIAAKRDNREQLNEVFSELATMQILISIFVVFIYFGYIVILYINNSDYFFASLLWSLYVISSAFDINWFFWGIEKFSITVFRNVLIKILTTIGIFTLVRSKNDIFIYIGLISFSYFLSSAILWGQLFKHVSFRRVCISNAFRHFKGNVVLFIPVIAVSIYTVMDKIMLGKISNMTDLGIYDNVQKIMTIPTGLITALGTVMLPRITNLIATGKWDRVFPYIDISMQFSSFFSIAIACGLTAIAPTFTVVYFGKEFKDAAFMMSMFTITITFIAWANVIRTQFLIPMGKDKVYIYSVCTGAIINLIVNLSCIPFWGAEGAVLGTILAECSVAIIQSVSVRKELPIKHYLKNSFIFILPGIIMIAIVRMLSNILPVSII